MTEYEKTTQYNAGLSPSSLCNGFLCADLHILKESTFEVYLILNTIGSTINFCLVASFRSTKSEKTLFRKDTIFCQKISSIVIQIRRLYYDFDSYQSFVGPRT